MTLKLILMVGKKCLYKMLKKIIRIMSCALLLVLIPINSNALCLFQSDYDADIWIEERIIYDIPAGVDPTWIPLRAASEHLPIDVSWDEAERKIVIYSHLISEEYPQIAERRYSTNAKSIEYKVVNGVTYCSPKFISRFLKGYKFIYGNELYFFNGEYIKSKLIIDGNSNVFAGNVITAMYNLKLKMPEEYEFVRKHITGGVKYVPTDKVDADAVGATAYMIAGENRPKCYIVGDSHYGHTLASYIAHEAYHVWQYQNYGHSGVIETDANAYERYVSKTLKGSDIY